jgi:magnesium transporter
MIVFKNIFNSSQNLSFIHGTVVAFVPMIAAISGNAGLQTSAIVVTGLATGDLAALKLSQVFMREVRVALLVALSCGIVGGLICGVFIHSDFLTDPENASNVGRMQQIALAFGTAMFSAIMVATTLGLFLPFLFQKIGIDPAISSGPLVTTANDSISVAIYLTLTLSLLQL